MTKLKMRKSVINVGVDAGKSSLDVHLNEKDIHFQVTNDAEGIKELLKRLCHYQVERLVVEATGRYQFALVEACYEKEIPVCIVQPLVIKSYARSCMILA